MSTRQRAYAAALLSSLIFSAVSQAAPIIGARASTTIPFPPESQEGTDISNIVNGSGLFDANTFLPLYSTAALHSAAEPDSVFAGDGPGSITFDLGGLFDLDGMAIWNLNGGGGGGVKDLSILGSTDGITFRSISGAPNHFAIGADAASEAAELFSFFTTASFVRFDIASSYGFIPLGSFGLSEAMFTGTQTATPVPLPPSFAMLGGGIGMLFLMRWRRRSPLTARLQLAAC